MIKKVIVILIVLTFLTGCSKKEDFNSSDNISDEYAFMIKSEEPSYSYPTLTIIRIETKEQEEFALLVPCEYSRTYNGFMSIDIFNGSWNLSVSEKREASNLLDSFEPFSKNCCDSGIVVANNSCMRYIKDLDANYVSFLYLVDIENSTIIFELNFNEDSIDDLSLMMLRELKDAYSMDALVLPEDEVFEIEEEISNYEYSEEVVVPESENLN